jgi:hypothetical protein
MHLLRSINQPDKSISQIGVFRAGNGKQASSSLCNKKHSIWNKAFGRGGEMPLQALPLRIGKAAWITHPHPASLSREVIFVICKTGSQKYPDRIGTLLP